MPTSPKESGVSCVPHGTRGKEMIKAVRFPGSSWCLRWVLIWEESRRGYGRLPSASVLNLPGLQMT
ncbi:mCG140438 [Mus musculus]|nr:mCG140438 [Mus musculus]